MYVTYLAWVQLRDLMEHRSIICSNWCPKRCVIFLSFLAITASQVVRFSCNSFSCLSVSSTSSWSKVPSGWGVVVRMPLFPKLGLDALLAWPPGGFFWPLRQVCRFSRNLDSLVDSGFPEVLGTVEPSGAMEARVTSVKVSSWGFFSLPMSLMSSIELFPFWKVNKYCFHWFNLWWLLLPAIIGHSMASLLSCRAWISFQRLIMRGTAVIAPNSLVI